MDQVRLSRRTLLHGAGAATGLATLGALTGCGGASRTGSGTRSIEHRFGRTAVPTRAKRVVALGGGDMEAAIALGVVPVGGADWFGLDKELRPWVADALPSGAERPTLLQSAEPNFEEIVKLAPDVILYVNSTNDRKTYETLAKIAPTVAGPASVKNAYGVPWRQQVDLVGRATGRRAAVAEVVRETEVLVTAARKANPTFAGKTITAGVYSPGSMSVWMPSDPRMRLLAELGFTQAPAIAALDDGDFFVSLSPEKEGLMEADVVLVAALDLRGRVSSALRRDQVFQRLDAVRDGHAAYFPGPGTILTTTEAGNFSSAFSIGGPLGIKAALPELTRLLARAVGGALPG